MVKDSPAPPSPPDYQAAANAGRANQNTPFGSSTWTPAQAAQPAIPGTSGTPGHWSEGTNLPGSGPGVMRNGQMVRPDAQWVPATAGTAGTPARPAVAATNTTRLSPDLQSSLDSITGGLRRNLRRGPDLGSVGEVADKAYGAFTARLDPQWKQQQAAEQTQLRNQGLVPGGEAYNNAMRVFNNAKNDAYQQANLGAIQTMPQTYQLANDQYNQPLNQLNALRTGAQIQGPQFEGSADYLNAANMQSQYGQGLYNAQVGQQNAMTSGLFGLGSAGLMGLAMSDRRLKREVRKVADDERGWGIYRYRYLDDERSRIGVMADEVEKVRPDAVTMVNGYKAVYYGRLYA